MKRKSDSHNLIDPGLCGGSVDKNQTVFIRHSTLDQVVELNWNRVQQLYVRPLSDRPYEIESEHIAGNESGCYVSTNQSRVLLIGATEEQIQNSIRMCGSDLHILDLAGSMVSYLRIGHLQNLRKLILSNCSRLVELPEFEHHTQLTSLDLSGCNNLIALPGLGHLTKMTRLRLSHCTGLITIPDGIRYMTALRCLDLRGLHLQKLPDWLPEIAEAFSLDPLPLRCGSSKAIVFLRDTTVEDMIDMSIFEQPYEVIVEWFHSRKKAEPTPLNEIKVVFLGDGEAGKSHIIARLMNDGGDPIDYVAQSTPGIVIKNKEYDMQDRRIHIHFWDFGGQEILHSMHRMFLTTRTLYVIVVNARDDTQHERARYWLQSIKSFTADSSVLLVLNKIDQNPGASLDEVNLRSRYRGLSKIVKMSALTFDRVRFNREFTDVLLNEIKKTGYLDAVWPTSWVKAKNMLQNMTTNYIRGNQYQQICNVSQVDRNQMELLHWFNDLGVSFCYTDSHKLSDYVVLRPDWITNALYTLLFNPIRGNRNGIIPHKEIIELLSGHTNGTAKTHKVLPDVYYSWQDIEYVLGVMRKFRLSFAIDEDREMIPMLCNRNSSLVVYEYEDDDESLEIRLVYEFLPSNVIHQLMVAMRRDLDCDNVWFSGARFVSHTSGTSAVVYSEGTQIRIIVRSENNPESAHMYMATFRTALQDINQSLGLKEQEVLIAYKEDGRTEYFDYEMLITSLECGQTQIFSKYRRKMVSIQNILGQSDSDDLAAREQLLDDILLGFKSMQDNRTYWDATEDMRNTYLRDMLQMQGYYVLDQTLRGISAFQREFIETDLDIRLHPDKSFALYEAYTANSYSSFRMLCDRYVGKMLNYAIDRQMLVLACYTECQKNHFQEMIHRCREHLRTEYGSISTVATDKLFPDNPNAAVMRCLISKRGFPVELYFVFVRFGL